MVRDDAERDDVGEGEAGCALAREALDEFLHADLRHRFVEAEAGRVAERQQIDQRAEILRRRLAQHDRATGQQRQLIAPGGGADDCGFSGHLVDRQTSTRLPVSRLLATRTPIVSYALSAYCTWN